MKFICIACFSDSGNIDSASIPDELEEDISWDTFEGKTLSSFSTFEGFDTKRFSDPTFLDQSFVDDEFTTQASSGTGTGTEASAGDDTGTDDSADSGTDDSTARRKRALVYPLGPKPTFEGIESYSNPAFKAYAARLKEWNRRKREMPTRPLRQNKYMDNMKKNLKQSFRIFGPLKLYLKACLSTD